jgi:hypothetical protein
MDSSKNQKEFNSSKRKHKTKWKKIGGETESPKQTPDAMRKEK